jgi:ABC-type transport system involved in multi-copper enzyme maturation permease subunit
VIGHLLVIARAATREAVRSRLFVSLLVLYGVLLVGGAIVDASTVGESGRVYHDLAQAALGVSGSMVAVFVGIHLLATDIERKTLHLVLARPVTRAELVLGKYLGLATVLLFNCAVATALYFVVGAGGAGTAPTFAKVVALLALGLEFLVVGAVATLFAALTTTPTTAAVYSVLFFVVGRLGQSMGELAERFPQSIYRDVSAALLHVLPDLTRFDLDPQVPLPGVTGLLWLVLYAGLWCAALLALAAFVFGRRDLR